MECIVAESLQHISEVASKYVVHIHRNYRQNLIEVAFMVSTEHMWQSQVETNIIPITF